MKIEPRPILHAFFEFCHRQGLTLVPIIAATKDRQDELITEFLADYFERYPEMKGYGMPGGSMGSSG